MSCFMTHKSMRKEKLPNIFIRMICKLISRTGFALGYFRHGKMCSGSLVWLFCVCHFCCRKTIHTYVLFNRLVSGSRKERQTRENNSLSFEHKKEHTSSTLRRRTVSRLCMLISSDGEMNRYTKIKTINKLPKRKAKQFYRR